MSSPTPEAREGSSMSALTEAEKEANYKKSAGEVYRTTALRMANDFVNLHLQRHDPRDLKTILAAAEKFAAFIGFGERNQEYILRDAIAAASYLRCETADQVVDVARAFLAFREGDGGGQ